MKTVVVRTIEILLSVGILATTIHLLLLLYFAGYSLTLPFITLGGQHIAPPTMLLMTLILARVFMRRCSSARKELSAYIPAILFCALLILYLANGVTKASGDTLPARYLPLSMLREGNFDLNEFQFLYAQGLPYYLRHLNGRYVSNYPVGPALAALPFYLISALGAAPPSAALFEDLEKLAAASLVALSACILYLALRYLTSGRVSLLLTVIYALGTSSFSVSSQALWQHGPSQLAMATGLYSLLRGRKEPVWICLAGFSLGFAVICRPTNLFLILPLGAYVMFYHRAQVGKFLLGALLPALFQLWYNYAYLGDPFFQPYGISFWTAPLMQGIGGLLFSPGRGLFIYSPVLLGSFLGIVLTWSSHGEPLLRALSVGILPTLLLYGKWIDWWGGWCYGPRLLADLTPILAVCLVPCVARLAISHRIRWLSLGGKWLFLVLTLWSLWAHALGALWDDSRWNTSPVIGLVPYRLWSVGSSPLAEYGKDVLGRAWIALRGIPTSLSAPELLSAAYHIAPSSFEVGASSGTAPCPVRLCITAVNTGQSVWLAALGSDKGTVKLTWRWMQEGREVSGFAGTELLRHDVFPGRSYEFQISFLHMPTEPGQYGLELELASGYFGKFSVWGSTPASIPVTVPSRTIDTLLQDLDAPMVASPVSPRLRFVLDREGYHHGEHLYSIYQIVGTEQPVLSDAYLALRQPNGDVALASLSGSRLINPTGYFRSEISLYIHKGSRFSGMFHVPLIGALPRGNYTVYFLLTEAGSYRVLAKATAQFFLEP